jgi:hypothetical protein
LGVRKPYTTWGERGQEKKGKTVLKKERVGCSLVCRCFIFQWDENQWENVSYLKHGFEESVLSYS